MRIKLNFTKNTSPVSRTNISFINSFIHSSLGKNEYHDTYSNYNVSKLLGGKPMGNYEDYQNGGYILLSSPELEFINEVVSKIKINKELCFGMKYIGFEIIEDEKFYNGWNNIRFLSPLLLRQNVDNKLRYCLYSDDDFIDILTKNIKTKLYNIDESLVLDDFKIVLSESSKNKIVKVTTKCVNDKDVWCIANMCNLNIYTNIRVMNLLYNIGIGNSNGSGFGTFIFRKKK